MKFWIALLLLLCTPPVWAAEKHGQAIPVDGFFIGRVISDASIEQGVDSALQCHKVTVTNPLNGNGCVLGRDITITHHSIVALSALNSGTEECIVAIEIDGVRDTTSDIKIGSGHTATCDFFYPPDDTDVDVDTEGDSCTQAVSIDVDAGEAIQTMFFAGSSSACTGSVAIINYIAGVYR